MLARGLVEIRSGMYGMRALFTATGIAGVKALLADARRIDPEAYAPCAKNWDSRQQWKTPKENETWHVPRHHEPPRGAARALPPARARPRNRRVARQKRR
jgi:hypothetical protein